MDHRPRGCVWELTLACNLSCTHCGSAAGRPLPDELDTTEALDLVHQLARLGCEKLTLSGGEPTLRPDWDAIARAAVDHGIYVNMVTNGVYPGERAADIARRAQRAGMGNVALSLDGPPAVHDGLRAPTGALHSALGRGSPTLCDPGSYRRTMRTLQMFRDVGLPVAVITTVSRTNLPHLLETHERVTELGAFAWMVQPAIPMGRMAVDLQLEPQALLTLIPLLAGIHQRPGPELHVGDGLGYCGPHETALRRPDLCGRPTRWQGCQAGLQVMGIQADGGIKGCLSLQHGRQRGDPFLEGNVRHTPLAQIWRHPGAFAYNRAFRTDQLGPTCRACAHAATCRGGALCLASTRSGQPPLCHLHQLALAEATRGRRSPWPAMAAAAAMLLSIGWLGTSDAATDGAVDLPAMEAGVSDGVARDGGTRDAGKADVPTAVAMYSAPACSCSFGRR